MIVLQYSPTNDIVDLEVLPTSDLSKDRKFRKINFDGKNIADMTATDYKGQVFELTPEGWIERKSARMLNNINLDNVPPITKVNKTRTKRGNFFEVLAHNSTVNKNTNNLMPDTAGITSFVVTNYGPYYFETDIVTDVEDDKTEVIPSAFKLEQNYPNPFNPTTKIKYSIPARTQRVVSIQLNVYDILGRVVAKLVSENKQPGEYEVEFNAPKLPSGVYFYQLQAGDFVQTKKMMLLK